MDDAGFLQGLNVHCGFVTNRRVAADLGHAYCPPEQALRDDAAVAAALG